MKPTKLHLIISAIASIPFFWVAERYMDAFRIRETEALATAATISFFGFAFVGRYLAIKWGNLIPFPLRHQYTVLGALIAWTGLFLLIYPNFNPLHSMPGINLLMYWVPFILLSLSVGFLIKLVRMNDNALEEARKRAIQSQTELKLLQAQISPHFLFNTLNNLYGISLTRHEKIPPLLLKLSDLLRYSVYDAKELFVSLSDELNYLNNYIDFEKIRIGDRLVINTDIAATDNDVQIAPMILIIFVENAFKHAKNSTDQNIYIDIKLETPVNSIFFSIKNSYQENQGKGIDKYSGFGLDNVRKRLDLLYPGRYVLKTEIKDDFYNVSLQLKVK